MTPLRTVWTILFFSLQERILVAGDNQCGDWVPLLGSCYLFSDDTATWGAAMGICRGFHSDLVSIGSNDENLLIEGYLQNKHPHDGDKTGADYWTGGNDIESEGNFKWIGSEEPFTYTNWMIGQPDPSEQDCVEIRGVSNFRWHDETCNHPHRFICEKPMGSPPEIIG